MSMQTQHEEFLIERRAQELIDEEGYSELDAYEKAAEEMEAGELG